jgi:hypothetical protein
MVGELYLLQPIIAGMGQGELRVLYWIDICFCVFEGRSHIVVAFEVDGDATFWHA